MRRFFFIVIFVLLFSCYDKEYNKFSSKYSSGYLFNLLIAAKKSIIEQFEKEEYKHFTDIVYSDNEQGIFVRLLKKGKERGCIGFYDGVESLEEVVKVAAVNAAFFDPRFSSLKEDFDSI